MTAVFFSPMMFAYRPTTTLPSKPPTMKIEAARPARLSEHANETTA